MRLDPGPYNTIWSLYHELFGILCCHLLLSIDYVTQNNKIMYAEGFIKKKNFINACTFKTFRHIIKEIFKGFRYFIEKNVCKA